MKNDHDNRTDEAPAASTSTPTVKSVYDTYATVADVRDAFETVSAPADRTEGKD